MTIQTRKRFLNATVNKRLSKKDLQLLDTESSHAETLIEEMIQTLAGTNAIAEQVFEQMSNRGRSTTGA